MMDFIAALAGLLLTGVLVKGSLVVLVGWLLSAALRGASSAVRHGSWMGVFLGLAVVAGTGLVQAGNSFAAGAEPARATGVVAPSADGTMRPVNRPQWLRTNHRQRRAA